MKGNGRVWLQQLAVQCAQDARHIIGAGGRLDDARLVVNGLKELANDQGHRLDTFNLFLRSQKLPLEVLLFVLDVLFLKFEKLQLPLQRLERRVQVLLNLFQFNGRGEG